MCLSKVFADEKGKRRLVMEEVSRAEAGPEGVQVYSLFGEREFMTGYSIAEVNPLENFLVLEKKSGASS